MTILSVSQITSQINDKLEAGFPFVWVRGQVSNLSRPSSGHLYFTLRDENSLLAAVWFRGNQREHDKVDPLTGEVFEDGPRPALAGTMQNGDEVLCAGKVTVYASKGQYQLLVEMAQPVGQGQLQAEFEKLKARLAAKGFFDQTRKRPLPRNPTRVALLTSPVGAALQDFIKISHDRGYGASLRLYPVPVQGVEAAPAIIKAIENANTEGWAELIIIIRGGGSLEDLWAFNDETLASAVVNSRLPVLAGIGHEVDFTLTDLSADLRAATPSHAAQLTWPERREFVQKLDELSLSLERAWQSLLTQKYRLLQTQERALALLSPERRLERQNKNLAALAERLSLSIIRAIKEKEKRHGALTSVLKRAFGQRDINQHYKELNTASNSLEKAIKEYLASLQRQRESLVIRLEANNPLAPLERGYALLSKGDGAYVKSIAQVQTGDTLQAKVSDGEFQVIVTKQ